MKNWTDPTRRTYTALLAFPCGATAKQIADIAGLPVNIVGRHLHSLANGDFNLFERIERVGDKFRLG